MKTVSFEEQLQDILNDLTLTSADRQSYTKDAEQIRNYIIDRMKSQDPQFGVYFRGASLTGSYLDDLKIDKPDEFDIHIKLSLSVPLRVQKAINSPGAVVLHAKFWDLRGPKHLMSGQYVSRIKLQRWIRGILEPIFANDFLNIKLTTGRSYRVEYSKTQRGKSVAHTFLATELKNKSRKISFDFVPAFEFDKGDWIFEKNYPQDGIPWFAVPSPKSKDLPFMPSPPHLERELLKDKKNLKNSWRLFKAIRDSNDMPQLFSYLIKTNYLWEAERHRKCKGFWEQPMGDLLIYMVNLMVNSLRSGQILFYWNTELNMLDRMQGDVRRDYYLRLKVILNKLKFFSKQREYNEELDDIFGC